MLFCSVVKSLNGNTIPLLLLRARSRRGASTGVAGLHCVKDDGKAEGTGGREVWSVIDAGDLGEHRGVPANATGAEDEGDVHAGGAPPPARAR